MLQTAVLLMLISGDPIIGCPLGVEKGKVWLFTKSMYQSATKALWNENPNEEPGMVPLPDGWKMQKLQVLYRTEFGLTDRLTVGFALPFITKDVEKDVWKKTPQGATKKHVKIKARGFSDPYLFFLYKVVKEHSVFEAVSLGFGTRFDLTDDPLVVKGIGGGYKAYRFAFLTHFNVTHSLHGVSNLWYENRGKIRDIKVRNEQGQMVDWQKSGYYAGDGFGYKLGFEKEFTEDGKFVGVLFFTGFWKVKDKDGNGKEVSNTDYTEHAVVSVLQYLPLGGEHEHSKKG